MGGAARAGSSSREAGGSVGIVCTFLFDPFRLQSHICFELIHVYVAADSISPLLCHILPPLGLGRLLVELHEGTGPNENSAFFVVWVDFQHCKFPHLYQCVAM